MATTTLTGFASLPADTFAPGPQSGRFITGTTNGRTLPFPGQPVQGFSGVQFASDTTFWFMPDNGFGAKNNSADFLLRIYQVDPNFRGLENGDGRVNVNVQNFIQLSDPKQFVFWPTALGQSFLSTSATVPTLEDSAPFLLPAGFTQRKITDRTTANRDPDIASTFGLWDMISLDPSNRYIFIPSEVGAGAGLFRYDTQTGDFVTALRGNNSGVRSTNPATWNPLNDDFARFDPATYTPYNTVITGEEGGNGRLFEWLNPLAAPGVTPQVAWRSNIPAVAHEGLRFDARGTLYFVDESNTGSIYKFVPRTVGDLSVGQTFVLRVTGFTGKASDNWDATPNSPRTGAATWVPITDTNGNALTATNPFNFATFGGRGAADDVGGTPYGRPEDIEIVGNKLYVAITSENTVLAIDLTNPTTTNVVQFANRSTLDRATGQAVGSAFANVDNLTSDAAGNLYFIEDGEPNGGDIWKAVDSNGDGVADYMGRWASLGVRGSEPTGLIPTNDPNKFLVAIQHPTSGNDAIWEITTPPDDRRLTGFDFDIESFVIANNGDIWVGEEFGPYLLRFNSKGELLQAPIATPNPVNLPTLGGKPPIVIGHRGASGSLPEHTLEAYKLAIDLGADFVEPDLVATKDGVLIARHEPTLGTTTDVGSRPEFANRKRSGIIDGVQYDNEFFASDFTLAEIKTLRAVMPQGDRTQLYNGVFQIPTFAEIIDLLKQVEKDTGKKIGVYPETKHPTYHDDLGLSLEEKLIDTLVSKQFTDPSRIYIQSFEVSNLQELNSVIMPKAGVNIPLVQLLDAFDVANDGTLLYEDVNARPYDFTVRGDTRTYADLQTAQGLAEIATYAEGIGPWKRMIVSVKTVDNNNDGRPDDLNNDGRINDADKVTLPPTTLVQDAHTAGLLVHPYTFRNEAGRLASNYQGNPNREYEQFLKLGVDGYFSDFPGTGDLVRDQLTSTVVRSPSHPDVLRTTTFNTLDGKAPIVIGHRGASGDRPEHTLAAYKKAIADGADFIEPDLVVTKDGVLIARHEPMLGVVLLNADGTLQRDANGRPVLNTTDTSTDVATRAKFADRLTVKNLDGRLVGGWFAEDFTLAEVKELNAIERLPGLRSTAFDRDGLKVPTLAEVIELVQQVERETGRKIGIYPETKHPTFFQQQGFNTSQLLVNTLVDKKFTDPTRIFIQSFEVSNLKALNSTLMPAANIDIPLVQLFGGAGQPYDFVVSNDARTYDDLAKPTGLAEIATYAAGIGPNKQRIVPLSTVDRNNDGRPDDLNGDGQISDGDRVTGAPTTLIQDAHKAGLLVHLYTLRNESFFLPSSYSGDPANEYKQFINLGVDGFFTDFPGTGFTTRSTFIQPPAVANLGGSRGYEGMAISPDRKTLYPLLEGSVVGDPTNALRIYEVDAATGQFKGIKGFYRMENPAHAIGDMTVINDNEYLVIERDNGQGADARFKKIYKIDLSRRDANGFFAKEEVADLLNIQDPNDLNGDGSGTYRMPFVTIEDVLLIDANTILVANDNNYPFSIGRPPVIDNNEIVVLKLDKPLAIDPRVGLEAVGQATWPVIRGGAGDDVLFGTSVDEVFEAGAGNNVVYAGEGRNAVIAGNGNNTIYGGASADRVSLGNGNNLIYAGEGNNTLITGGGRDLIYAGAGDDTILAGAGDDLIYAGEGNNTISTGTGNDTVYTGSGRDRFVLDAGAGAVTIVGWGIGDSVSRGSGVAATAQIAATVIGNDTQLSVGSDLLAIVKDVRLSTVAIV
jgi:glycerophosphoryl diester phosphodiesterase